VSSHVEITTSDGFGFSGYEGFIEKIKNGNPGLIAGITPRFTADSIISKDEYSTGIRLIGADFTSESMVSSFFPRHEVIYSKSRAAAEIKKPGPAGALKGRTPPGVAAGEGPAAELPVLLAGKALYDKFKMSPGDRLKVTTITSEAYFSPLATFEIGIYDYDLSYCFCEIKTLQKLSGYDGVATSILVKLNDIGRADEFAEKIKSTLNDASIIVRTYRQINKSLFATIKIERMVLFLIIFLCLALANMAVAFVISQNVYRRAKTIAIMNALGADTVSIMKIFFYEGLIYGAIGLAAGAAAGIGCGLLIDWISIGVPREVTLYYSVTSVPVKLNYINILIISSIELFVLLMSSVMAARKIFKADIIESLRNS
jgi:lipoprotein-releasing system permease protein